MDWNKLRLKEVAKIRNDRRTPKAKKIANIPMELISNEFPFCEYELKEKNKIKSYTYCESGDILLAKITPSLENGKQGIVPQNIPDQIAFATTEVFPIVPESINSLFLYYILKFPKYRNKIIASMIGTTGRQRATKKSIENLVMEIPTKPIEQKAIAEILSTVDEAIQKADEAIKKTERIKQGVMHKLLTEGIGHKEFKQTKIGKIPKEWEVSTLGNCGEFQYGFTASTENKDTGIKFLRITDIDESGKVDWQSVPYCSIENKDLEKYQLNVGDILFARIGATAGKTSLINQQHKAVFASYLIRYKNLEKLLPEYVFYFTKSNLYWNQALRKREGQLKKGMNANTLSELNIPIPARLDEQQEIVDRLLALDHLLDLNIERKRTLERIKLGLMNDLLTGKKRVRVN